MEIAALLISLASLFFSIGANFINRRTRQFQRLAVLRTKNVEIKLETRHFALDSKRLIDNINDSSSVDTSIVTRLNRLHTQISDAIGRHEDYEKLLDELYAELETIPWTIPESKIGVRAVNCIA
jgi:hypothetical protein